MKFKAHIKLKRAISFVLVFVLAICVFSVKGNDISASADSDYSVLVEAPDVAEIGTQISLKVTVTDITYPEFDSGKGIFGVAIFLYYDSNVFTPASGGFSATVPYKWDKFDGTTTKGVWGLYAVFDGNLTNGAVNDGDITFNLTFNVSEAAPSDTYTFYVADCECTGYSSKSLLKIKSYNATAYFEKDVFVPLPEVLVPNEDVPFTFDYDNGIIYSDTPDIDYNEFVSYFSNVNGELIIKAFDYEVTSENGSFIPNGANISVYHQPTGQTISFTYYLLGDCDCNGRITVSDLAVVKSVITNNTSVDGYLEYAMDFEKDGVIRIADYLRLKVYISSK